MILLALILSAQVTYSVILCNNGVNDVKDVTDLLRFYIGIERSLNQIIDSDIFIEKEISVLIHIDGIHANL